MNENERSQLIVATCKFEFRIRYSSLEMAPNQIQDRFLESNDRNSIHQRDF